MNHQRNILTQITVITVAALLSGSACDPPAIAPSSKADALSNAELREVLTDAVWQNLEHCSGLLMLRLAIDEEEMKSHYSPDVTYHPDLVDTCVTTLQAMGCRTIEIGFPWSCDYAADGAGGGCYSNDECRRGERCGRAPSSEDVCGTCVTGGGIGEACDDYELACGRELLCIEGTCQAPVAFGEACGPTAPCDGGMQCVDGVCSGIPQELPPLDGACTEDDHCDPVHTGQVCIDGSCAFVSVRGLGEECDARSTQWPDAICEFGNGPSSVRYCVDIDGDGVGVCSEDASPIGGNCDTFDGACEYGIACLDFKCVAPQGPGEPCGDQVDGSFLNCAIDARCERPANASGSLGGTCVAWALPGESCANICNVELGTCDEDSQLCRALPGDGEECALEYLCDGDSRCRDDGLCHQLLEDGDACAAADECRSDSCALGRCTSDLAGACSTTE